VDDAEKVLKAYAEIGIEVSKQKTSISLEVIEKQNFYETCIIMMDC